LHFGALAGSLQRPARPGLISPNVKKRLDKPRSIWYNGAGNTIAFALRFRTGARAPKFFVKPLWLRIFGMGVFLSGIKKPAWHFM